MELSAEVQQAIRELAAIAKPTEERLAEVFEGWKKSFAFTGTMPERQLDEFNAIMRMRVSVGIVSILADDPDAVLDGRIAPAAANNRRGRHV